MKFLFIVLLTTLTSSFAYSATIVPVKGSASYVSSGSVGRPPAPFNSLEQQGVQYAAMLDAIQKCIEKGLSNCSAKSSVLEYCNNVTLDSSDTMVRKLNCKANAVAIGIDYGNFDLKD